MASVISLYKCENSICIPICKMIKHFGVSSNSLFCLCVLDMSRELYKITKFTLIYKTKPCDSLKNLLYLLYCTFEKDRLHILLQKSIELCIIWCFAGWYSRPFAIILLYAFLFLYKMCIRDRILHALSLLIMSR